MKLCWLLSRMSCDASYAGIPVIFVAIGLAAAHDHYVVFDSDGDPL